MSVEIERKFLILKVPQNLKKTKGKLIFQGYLAVEEGGNEVRIRKKEQHYFMTVKNTGKLQRKEAEINIHKKEFDRLLPLCGERTVEKTRYEIPFGKHTIELDVFSGQHKGLMVAEVEFKDEKESLHFKKPAWFGREVTALQSYKNKNLAVHGLPN